MQSGPTKMLDRMSQALKTKYLSLLQKRNSWGKSEKFIEEEIERIFELIKFPDDNLEALKRNAKIKPKTTLLIGTNLIKSDIQIDLKEELPVFELFIDDNDFFVFTTSHIYSGKNGFLSRIVHEKILAIDEKSMTQFAENKDKQFISFELVVEEIGNIPIYIENGIPLRPVISLLQMLIDRKLSF